MTPDGVIDLDSLSKSELRLFSEPVDLADGEKAQMLGVLRAIEKGEISMLFRLPPRPSQRDIKRAYFGLSKLYHPDRYFGRSLGPFEPILERIFATLAQYVRRRGDARAMLGSRSEPQAPRRRRNERHEFAVKVALRFHARGALEGHETSEVSWGGIFVATHTPANLGERVDVRLVVPDAPAVTMPGVVVHVRRAGEPGRPPGIGIRLEPNTDDAGRVIRKLIALARRGGGTGARHARPRGKGRRHRPGTDSGASADPR